MTTPTMVPSPSTAAPVSALIQFARWPPSPEEQTLVLQALSQDLVKDAIQRSKGIETHKGYNTSGYGYQYIVNRLNEVLGLGGWTYDATYETEAIENASQNKRTKFTAQCRLVLKFGRWEMQNNEMVFVYWAKRESIGGHESFGTKTDAIKGAFSNALKKTAALFGCGHQAYLGLLDEDNTEAETTKRVTVSHQTAPTPPTAQAARPSGGPVQPSQRPTPAATPATRPSSQPAAHPPATSAPAPAAPPTTQASAPTQKFQAPAPPTPASQPAPPPRASSAPAQATGSRPATPAASPAASVAQPKPQSQARPTSAPPTQGQPMHAAPPPTSSPSVKTMTVNAPGTPQTRPQPQPIATKPEPSSPVRPPAATRPSGTSPASGVRVTRTTPLPRQAPPTNPHA